MNPHSKGGHAAAGTQALCLPATPPPPFPRRIIVADYCRTCGCPVCSWGCAGGERVYCSYCGATGVVRRPTAVNFYAEHMEIDHVVPRHLGGALDVSNLAWACMTCNRRKGHLADWTSPNGALVNGRWAR